MSLNSPSILGPTDEELQTIEQSRAVKLKALAAARDYGVLPPEKPKTALKESTSKEALEAQVPLLLAWYRYLGWATADIDNELTGIEHARNLWHTITRARNKLLASTYKISNVELDAAIEQHPAYLAYNDEYAQAQQTKRYLAASFGYVDRALKTIRPATDGVRAAPRPGVPR